MVCEEVVPFIAQFLSCVFYTGTKQTKKENGLSAVCGASFVKADAHMERSQKTMVGLHIGTS